MPGTSFQVPNCLGMSFSKLSDARAPRHQFSWRKYLGKHGGAEQGD